MLVAALLVSADAVAQVPKGSLSGTVTDPSGAQVRSANVTLFDGATKTGTFQTGDDGGFFSAAAANRSIDLRVSLGF